MTSVLSIRRSGIGVGNGLSVQPHKRSSAKESRKDKRLFQEGAGTVQWTLRDWGGRIEAYLTYRLALALNPTQPLTPVSKDIDFLGYIFCRDYCLVRRRKVGHLKEQLGSFEVQLVQTVSSVRRYRFDPEVLDRRTAALALYLRHLKWAQI